MKDKMKEIIKLDKILAWIGCIMLGFSYFCPFVREAGIDFSAGRFYDETYTMLQLITEDDSMQKRIFIVILFIIVAAMILLLVNRPIIANVAIYVAASPALMMLLLLFLMSLQTGASSSSVMYYGGKICILSLICSQIACIMLARRIQREKKMRIHGGGEQTVYTHCPRCGNKMLMSQKSCTNCGMTISREVRNGE